MSKPDKPDKPDAGGKRKIRVQDRRSASKEADAAAAAEQGQTQAQAGDDAGDAGDLANDPLIVELEEARRLAEDRLDQLRRLKADYENSRQRMIREQTEVIERASSRVIESLMPVLDDFELALSAARQRSPEDTFVKGVELVFRKLHEVLASEGLEAIQAEGARFDPHEHEAMASETGDVSEPTVLQVVRPGYRVKGKLVRAALVRVALPGGQADASAEAGADDGQDEESGGE